MFKGLLDSLLKNSKNKQIKKNKDKYSSLNKNKTGFDSFNSLITKLEKDIKQSRSQSRNQSNITKPINKKEISRAFFTDSKTVDLKKRKEIINSLIKSLAKMKDHLKKKEAGGVKKGLFVQKASGRDKMHLQLITILLGLLQDIKRIQEEDIPKININIHNNSSGRSGRRSRSYQIQPYSL